MWRLYPGRGRELQSEVYQGLGLVGARVVRMLGRGDGVWGRLVPYAGWSAGSV